MNDLLGFSTKKLGAVLCHNRGYEVIDNEVHFNGKIRKLDVRFKKDNGQSSYASFGIRDNNGKRIQVFVHHLVAYKKFGKIFIDSKFEQHNDLIVLHLDGNTLNNSYDNIILGTRGQASELRMGQKIEIHVANKVKNNPEYY
jgi:hypothetical protein